MARRIDIVRAPFDYEWPKVQAVTHFTQKGRFLVKDEVADFAVRKGYATEAPEDKTAAPKRATRRRAQTAHQRGTAGVDRVALADHARATHRRPVDPDAR